MARDIREACENNEQLSFALKKLGEKYTEIGKERSQFMQAQDQIRYQIRDYEKLLDESRGVHDRQLVEFKKEVTKRLEESMTLFQEMSVDRRQLKAMVKNQNFQFTELQKEIVMAKQRLNQVEKVCAETPGILAWMDKTDNYMQNYLPTEYFAETHYLLSAALKNAPNRIRLDHIEYSVKRVNEFMEKMK